MIFKLFTKLFIGILLFNIACQTKSDSKKQKPKVEYWLFTDKNDTIPVLEGGWKNTLNQYAKRDSLEVRGVSGFPFIKMLQVNKHKVALVFQEKGFGIYQFGQGGFTRISTNTLSVMPTSPITFNKVDLNMDGWSDLALSVSMDVYGNIFTYALIFDKKLKTFTPNSSFNLLNLTIDKEKKWLKSIRWSSAFGTSEKAIYVVKQGSAQLFKQVLSTPDYPHPRIWLHFTTNNKGTSQRDSILATPEKARRIFNDTLWKGRYTE